MTKSSEKKITATVHLSCSDIEYLWLFVRGQEARPLDNRHGLLPVIKRLLKQIDYIERGIG